MKKSIRRRERWNKEETVQRNGSGDGRKRRK